MCDPFTLSLASAGIGMVGGIAQGMMGAGTASRNAALLRRQEYLQRQKGEFDAAQAKTHYERTQGQAVANAGLTGLSLSSFADVFADSAMEGALKVKAIRWGAENEAKNLEFQAQSQEVQGKAAMLGGIFSGIGSGVAGLSKAYSLGGPTGSGNALSASSWEATVNPAFGA